MNDKADIQASSGSTTPQTSTEEILARGDIDIRLLLIKLIFSVVLILTVGGVAAFFWLPDRFKDLWVVIGPIVSGVVFAAVGYVAGEKRSLRRND
jgi:uncharacterized BrkB/YihY/UPF0761 family membrane protein